MATNDGGPAFPIDDGRKFLHDWFAGMAPPMPAAVQKIVEKVLDGLCANPYSRDGIDWMREYAKQEAKWRHIYADAMLAERVRTDEP